MSALPESANSQKLEALLREYDVGEVLRTWPASNGIENENYFIETQGLDRTHGFVLTILLGDSFAGEAYVPMMRLLSDHGLPVAPPVDNRNGQPVTEHLEQPCLLQKRLKGQHTVNPTLRQVESLARFIARMHLTTGDGDFVLPDYPRTESWLVGQATTITARLPYRDRLLLKDTLTQVTSFLSRRDVQALPRGLMHGDLFRDNVLFNERGLTGVLDFHHAATGYFIYDLAVAANDWCCDAAGLLDPDRTSRLLRAYHEIRPLSEAEVWYFSLFAVYAALVFWVSREVKVQQLDAQQKQSGNTRLKDPEEFKRILEHLQKHHFYLDYRILSHESRAPNSTRR